MKRNLVLINIGLLLAAPINSVAAEPTQDMRDLARMYASLEARDLDGYCMTMQTPSYAGYIGRVCEHAVKSKLKRPQDCTPENIAKQAKEDEQECLAMKPIEFEEKVSRVAEGKAVLLKEMSDQGIDGEKLLQEAARQRAAEQVLREREKMRAREACCAKPDPGKPRRGE